MKSDSLEIPAYVYWKKDWVTQSDVRHSQQDNVTCGYRAGDGQVRIGQMRDMVVHDSDERLMPETAQWTLYAAQTAYWARANPPYYNPHGNSQFQEQSANRVAGELRCNPPAADKDSGVTGFFSVKLSEASTAKGQWPSCNR